MVVQLDHDEDMGSMHGMCCTLDAEFEEQRTTKWAKLTAFLCLLRKVVGPTTAHVDNKGIIDGLWRGDTNCTGPKAKDDDLCILIWEEVRRIHQEGTFREVGHVKAHRSKKEKQELTLFERMDTEGHEGADVVTKNGWASTVQQKERMFTRHCSTQLAFTVWWRSGATVKNLSRNQRKSWLVRETKWTLRNNVRHGAQPRADTVA